MKHLGFNISLLDQYIGVFSRMNVKARKYLIDKLQNIHEEPKKNPTNKDLFGAWISDESADEMIASIHSSRSTHRDLEVF